MSSPLTVLEYRTPGSPRTPRARTFGEEIVKVTGLGWAFTTAWATGFAGWSVLVLAAGLAIWLAVLVTWRRRSKTIGARRPVMVEGPWPWKVIVLSLFGLAVLSMVLPYRSRSCPHGDV